MGQKRAARGRRGGGGGEEQGVDGFRFSRNARARGLLDGFRECTKKLSTVEWEREKPQISDLFLQVCTSCLDASSRGMNARRAGGRSTSRGSRRRRRPTSRSGLFLRETGGEKGLRQAAGKACEIPEGYAQELRFDRKKTT